MRKDQKEKRTPIHDRKESLPANVKRGVNLVRRNPGTVDQTMLVGTIGGSVYYKSRDYKDKKLLAKATGGRIDRSKGERHG